MAYTLTAFIGKAAAIEGIQKQLQNSLRVSLDQEFAMLPMTSSVLEALYYEQLWPPEDEVITGSLALTHRLEKIALEASKEGLLAYVEIELFGGTGLRSAVLWDSGSRQYGPALVDSDEGDEQETEPVNHALQLLGVVRGAEFDEFDALNLGRHRATDNWEAQ